MQQSIMKEVLEKVRLGEESDLQGILKETEVWPD